jgi:hypothetical protein
MKPEIKAQWIAALRSGKYPQTTHNLKTEQGFCCLGVLCDISGVGEWDDQGHGYEYYVVYGGRECSVLHSRLAKEIGWDVKNFGQAGIVPGLTLRDAPGEENLVRLTQLNDDGFTFDQIADIIQYFF